jgi:hypothetical protein
LSSYNPLELGEVQQKILKHFFECGEKLENVSHISKALGVLQPSVQRSVGELIKNHYLIRDTEYAKGKKQLLVTEKGAAAAIFLGINLDQLETFSKKHHLNASLSFLQNFKNTFKNTEKRDLYIKKAVEFYLKNNLFEEGNVRQRLTEEEKTRAKLNQLYIAREYFESQGFDFNNINNFRDFIDKYKIDRETMKKYLTYRRERIDRALKELERD